MLANLASVVLSAAILALFVPQVSAQPVPPCANGQAETTPAYGKIGADPAVQVWQDIELSDPAGCLGALAGRSALVIALAGQFDGRVSRDDIVARIGEISATQGLVYWSITDQEWRPLVTEAYGLEAPDSDVARPDFTALELLRGHPLYFMQNDSRSSGPNSYSLTVREMGPDRFVAAITNVTTIRFAFVTLFEPEALVSQHFFDRTAQGTWGYYGISVARSGIGATNTKSFVNRAAAFYRFLIGVAADSEPPLAR
ncbi:MAG: hypothetical protein O3B37_10335 [Proteobacteria bacterium]|nr:hypothetical protein [Pseudomonadota bacterium]